MKINESIFKAYDVRGIYPEQLNEEVMYAIGQGYVNVVKPNGPVAVGRDVRIHSEKLAKSLIEGLTDTGIDVVDIGLISTEMLYFAVGNYGYAGGIQVTASHNPAEWNGIKPVRANAEPISSETGLLDIKEFVLSGKKIEKEKGNVTKKDILDDFCKFVLGWIDCDKIIPLTVVYNPNFGYEGKVFERIIELGSLPLKAIPLNAEPDGTFPKGRPDPFIPENRTEFIQKVKDTNADFGVTWDADADRVFFCTDGGQFLEPYLTNTLLIEKMLKKNPNSKIIYDPRYTWALIDASKQNGGTPLLERVGHAFIKARMRKEGAVFAGESSGHTFYKDFWYADTGIIPLLQVMEIISQKGQKLSQILKPVLQKYLISGEINFTTGKAKEIIEQIKKKYADSTQSTLDGLSCEYPDWRFNLRCSNTEPLLRLNLEAKSEKLLNDKKKELFAIIK